ncbi:hypothetical protein N7492_010176 [Penicillium capsulatum]|uniref:AHC1-like C2H2 zinc-finger domain-containing protein n=1 Tax=Penicillium capsulatum TaxID=69766 RepID=A0A9W9LDN0_9EURO|nr:hypothetical protein N7492_010176 [Penicillium capsulatum]KAJ6112684.1 hypothetical protein N7512_008008 [Penicillium capsulatum]
MAEEVKMLTPCAGANPLSLPKLKRKRSDAVDPDAPVPTKLRVDTLTAAHPSPPSALSPVSDSSAVASASSSQAASAARVNRLRDSITAQLSLEVLLKHNELRFIDQEIAKCQVALEQLRRCAEIPYPGSAVTGPNPDVSAGTGASVLPPGNGLAPVSPAPWGVTDGPYSRHYARWLLPDARFDGAPKLPSMAPAPVSTEGRSTRGNPHDFSSLAGKTPRGSRNSMGTNHMLTGGPVPKEKPGPMLIRRKSDKVLVKLVCLDCQRDDFSSTQGFINHCRIAHNCNYASHDAAAVACGRPVQVDEHGQVVGEEKIAPEKVTAEKPTVDKKKIDHNPVHPLIRAKRPAPPRGKKVPKRPTSSKKVSNRPTKSTSRKPSFSSSEAVTPAFLTGAPEPCRLSEPISVNTSFLPSTATPHLSALIRDRGLGLNMNELVEEAKTPVDLTALSDDESGDESTSSDSREDSDQQDTGARQPMRMPRAGSEGGKGLGRATPGSQRLRGTTPSRRRGSRGSRSQGPRSSFLNRLRLNGTGDGTTDAIPDGDGMDHPSNHSPHTIESNQAPSLVSDDGDDYAVASDSDSPASSEDGDEDQEFRHIEVEDDERTATPTTTTEPKSGPTDPPAQPAPLSKPLKQNRPNNLPVMPSFNDHGSDDQHVNFAHRMDDHPDTQSDYPDGRNPSNL